MLKTKVIKVSWMFKGKEVSISSTETKSIFAYPTPDLLKMIVIYNEESKAFPCPDNAVVYNADGSFCNIIMSPQLNSKTAILQGPSWYKCFNSVWWHVNEKGKIVNAITIEYNDYYFEEREFDVDSGEFGEVIREGSY